MPQPNYQTVRLSRGKHQSPDKGVCVMELASMLAHEPFSDHPASVCPVIGSFLRTYNDALDDAHRQELYAFAARAIGTRGHGALERQRGEACVAFVERHGRRGVLGRLVPRWGKLTYPVAGKAEAAAVAAARIAAKRDDEASRRIALAFVDELIALGVAKTPAGQLPAAPAEPLTTA